MGEIEENCFICNNPLETKITITNHHRAVSPWYSVNCPQCGKYKVIHRYKSEFEYMAERQRTNLSGYIFENSGIEISGKNFEYLSNLPTPSFHEKADKLLLLLEKNTDFAGDYILSDSIYYTHIWCLNKNELDEIVNYLFENKRIAEEGFDFKDDRHINGYKILPNGWAYLEEIKKINQDSNQCFVAMWFDEDMTPIYDNCIAQAVQKAGYKPHRVDRREYTDKIDDEIIAQIRRSRFIVADFTGHRYGVYYEAGFAKGLGIEVIWTCRKDQMEELHFDIRQYNCIEWEDDKLDEFSKNLTNKIEAVLGRGTYQKETG